MKVMWSAVFAALVLFVGCARQMAPPGGPADKIPPRVVNTVPQNDSVRVDINTALHIEFSEKMDRRSVEEALFVSPQVDQQLQFKWQGNVLTVHFADALRPDRTYVITVGQASADEWRNRMVASHTFRFATGEAVNRGEILGRLTLSREQVGQTFAWLYDLDVIPEPDLVLPAAHYVTQPDAEGHFHFSGLGPGQYRAFAFVDADQNRAYSPGIDALAVPTQDVVLPNQGSFRLGDLQGVVRDTSAPTLSAVRTPDRNHVLMRFDEPVRIVSVPKVTGLDVTAIYQDVDSSRVGLFTSPQQKGQNYEVHISVKDRVGQVAEIVTPVRGDATADRRAPEILALRPALLADQILPEVFLEMVFADAMAQDVVDSFWVLSDSTWAPKGDFVWVASNHLVFRPEAPWPIGPVRLKSRVGAVKDLAGNFLDAPILFDFTVMDAQDVGSIVGTVLPLDRPAVIEAISLETHRATYRTLIAVGDSTFAIRGVLPGTYRISGFVDANGDGLWTAGQIWPFVPAEMLFGVTDTVDVSPRWQVDTRRLEARSGWFLVPNDEGES